MRTAANPISGGRLVEGSGDDDAVVAMAERLRLSVADLRPALAVGVVQQLAGDVMVIVAHHAITDGLGVLELLRSLLSGEPEPAESWQESAEALQAVGAAEDQTEVAGENASSSPSLWSRLSLSASRPVGDGAQSGTGFGYCQASLTHVSVSSDATVNDVLIAATVRAVERWNTRHGRPTGRVSVHMPMDSGSNRHEHRANATGQAIVFVNAADRAEDRLLSAVTRQTRKAKVSRGVHKGAAEHTVAALLRLPAAVRRPLLRGLARFVRRMLMPSVTVTNLGRLDKVAPKEAANPSALHFLTTAGMPQGITVTALGLNGRLHLVVCYAHQRFSDASARDFLTLIIEAMRELTSARISIAEMH